MVGELVLIAGVVIGVIASVAAMFGWLVIRDGSASYRRYQRYLVAFNFTYTAAFAAYYAGPSTSDGNVLGGIAIVWFLYALALKIRMKREMKQEEAVGHAPQHVLTYL